ncbi:hypothetical protein KY331_03905 [Candidatus Woesearchaeota archaeon]|nr:hypothetical protein [Candidatus Woesearchaeota archaeon]
MAIKNIKEVKECPECASVNITHNEKKQQVICRACGLIFEPLTPDFEEKYEEIAGIKSVAKPKTTSRKPAKKKTTKKKR